jgi:hypothetical protein
MQEKDLRPPVHLVNPTESEELPVKELEIPAVFPEALVVELEEGRMWADTARWPLQESSIKSFLRRHGLAEPWEYVVYKNERNSSTGRVETNEIHRDYYRSHFHAEADVKKRIKKGLPLFPNGKDKE